MIWNLIGTIGGKFLDIVDDVVEDKDEANRLKFEIQRQLIENKSNDRLIAHEFVEHLLSVGNGLGLGFKIGLATADGAKVGHKDTPLAAKADGNVFIGFDLFRHNDLLI